MLQHLDFQTKLLSPPSGDVDATQNAFWESASGGISTRSSRACGNSRGSHSTEEKADCALRYAAKLRLGPGAGGCCRCAALPSGTVRARVAARKVWKVDAPFSK